MCFPKSGIQPVEDLVLKLTLYNYGELYSLWCAGDKTLDGYQKKKYVCKLLFIFLLGHDIDFGHMEAVNLLSSNKYTEKQIVSAASSCFTSFFHILIIEQYNYYQYIFLNVTCRFAFNVDKYLYVSQQSSTQPQWWRLIAHRTLPPLQCVVCSVDSLY